MNITHRELQFDFLTLPPRLFSCFLDGVDNESIISYLGGLKDVPLSRDRPEDIPVDVKSGPDHLKDICDTAVEIISEELNINKQSLYYRYTGDNQDVWGQYRGNGQSIIFHNHAPALAACVYYASVPEGSSDLILMPNGFNPDLKHGGPIYRHTPHTNQLIFFPGHTPHFTLPHMGDEPRVAIAFNVHISGSQQGELL